MDKPDLTLSYAPWRDDIRERLTKLLPIDVLHEILRGGGVIAGGAVVYALVEDVRIASVDDIDVFFLGGGDTLGTTDILATMARLAKRVDAYFASVWEDRRWLRKAGRSNVVMMARRGSRVKL
jgi:hypothetical protein